MKVLGVVCIVAVIVALLLSYSPSMADRYENFLLDMDVSARMEVAITQVARGNDFPMLRENLTMLATDLQAYPISDEYVRQANDLFVQATTLLLACLDAKESGQPYESELEQAYASYRLARETCYLLKRSDDVTAV